jgi:hypothetical protein
MSFSIKSPLFSVACRSLKRLAVASDNVCYAAGGHTIGHTSMRASAPESDLAIDAVQLDLGG